MEDPTQIEKEGTTPSNRAMDIDDQSTQKLEPTKEDAQVLEVSDVQDEKKTQPMEEDDDSQIDEDAEDSADLLPTNKNLQNMDVAEEEEDESQNEEEDEDDDFEAEEEEDESDEDARSSASSKKEKRNKSNRKLGLQFLDVAAEHSGEEGSSDEEEDGEDDYARDGFVVDDFEEESEEESQGEKKKRRRKRRKRKMKHHELDEEDLAVAQENLGLRDITAETGSVRLKRLKQIQDEEKRSQRRHVQYDHDADDDLAGFVEPDPDEMPDEGTAEWHRVMDAERRTRKITGGASRILPAQLAEAAEIFGDVSGFLNARMAERSMDEEDMDATYGEEDDDADFGEQAEMRELTEKTASTQLKDSEAASNAASKASHLAGKAEAVAEFGVLSEVYEPSVLKDTFVLPSDDRVRRSDLPERLQPRLRSGKAGASTEELRIEAHWICEKHPELSKRLVAGGASLGTGAALSEEGQLLVATVGNVLNFMLSEHLEAPFIACYRKDYWSNVLSEDELYEVFELDRRFVEHFARVRRVMKELEGANLMDRQDQVNTLLSEYELRDISLLCRLHRARQTALLELENKEVTEGEEEKEALKKSKKVQMPARATHMSAYESCVLVGLEPLARRMGLTAAEFAQNLNDNHATNEPVNDSLSPLEAAEKELDRLRAEADQEEMAMVNAEQAGGNTSALQSQMARRAVIRSRLLSSPDSVLAACRAFLAEELAREPVVRFTMRQVYFKDAYISTRATAKGREMVDTFSRSRIVRRLERKPVVDFTGFSYLVLLQAERAGLIECTVHFASERLLERLYPVYCSDMVSKEATLWNEQRQTVLRGMMEELLPDLERELRDKLRIDAENALLLRCRRLMRERLTGRGPYIRPDGNPLCPQPVRVMSIIPGSGPKEPVVCAMVNEAGEVVEVLKLSFITTPVHDGVSKLQKERRRGDMENLGAFISRHRPDVFVVGASDLTARHLQRDLEETRNLLGQLDPLIHEIPIEFGSPEIARFHRGTKCYEKEFSMYPPIVREAVAVARELQDPLPVYCALWNSPDELCVPKLDPLQDQLPAERLREALLDEYVRAVNEIGVDINSALRSESAFAQVQFLCGLGPRKAAGLKSAFFRKTHLLMSRSELVKPLGNTVWRNAAGFLRIRPYHFSKEDRDLLNPLDNTRVHPDDYSFATKMAIDTVGEQPANDYEENELVRKLMASTTLLNILDKANLDEVAKEWESLGNAKQRLTLYDIKDELHAPFCERRPGYYPPSAHSLFYWMTGESPLTLQIGQLVHIRVFRVQENRALCRLGCGLLAVLDREFLSSSASPQTRMEDLVARGQCLVARLRHVEHERLRCFVSTRQEDLLPTSHYELDRVAQLRQVEPSLLSPEEEEEEWKALKAESDKKIAGTAIAALAKKISQSPRRSGSSNRAISHPLFQNMNYRDCEKYLKSKEIGEIVFRPSSKGMQNLTVSFKVSSRFVFHVDVEEKDKSNVFALGEALFVAGERYEDLDEIVARYVEPVVANVQILTGFRAYRDADRGEVEAELREQKAANPSRIPYLIWMSKKHQGHFVLSYLASRRARHEFIGITPDGFRLSKRVFSDPDRLIAWFKRNFREIARRSASQARSRQPQSQANNHQPNYNGQTSNYAMGSSSQGGPSSYPPPPSQNAWHQGGSSGGMHGAPPPPAPPVDMYSGAPSDRRMGGGSSHYGSMPSPRYANPNPPSQASW